jgi:RHS repeat-associated protein
MLMPGRKYPSTIKYRYGFNGKENDNEVKGEGNQQDYGMRIYDPRLGRFLSVDPITDEYPELTLKSILIGRTFHHIHNKQTHTPHKLKTLIDTLIENK